MSKIALEGNASGTGTLTIAAPNTSTDRTLTLPDNTGTVLTSASSIAASQLPAGSVLQVVSATKTDTFSYTGSTYTDVTGLSVSITPVSTSSKIYIIANISITADRRYSAFRFMRGSTAIGIGDSSGNRSRVTAASMRNQSAAGDEYILHNSSASFIDSPNTTSATTYKIQVANHHDAEGITYINNTRDDSDFTYSARGISTITVMEIAG